MNDFNADKADLIRHLKLTFQADDGIIVWYDGTLSVLFDFMKIAFPSIVNWVEKQCWKPSPSEDDEDKDD